MRPHASCAQVEQRYGHVVLQQHSNPSSTVASAAERSQHDSTLQKHGCSSPLPLPLPLPALDASMVAPPPGSSTAASTSSPRRSSRPSSSSLWHAATTAGGADMTTST